MKTIEIKTQAELDALGKEIDANIEINFSGAVCKAEKIGGDLYVYGSAKLDAPALTSVGGYLRVYGSAKLDALTSVGGYLRVYGSAKLDALTSVGGYLYVDGSAKLDAPNAKYNCAKTKSWAAEFSLNLRLDIRIKVRASFMANGFLFADGILGKIIAKKRFKGNVVYTTLVRGGLKTSYCVQKGEQFSHGETVEKAIESLRYKLSDRDTSRFKKWTPKTKVSVDEAIQAYRAITGACEFGVRSFCESTKIPKTLTVSKVIELTDGKYGSREFAGFFGSAR